MNGRNKKKILREDQENKIDGDKNSWKREND